MQKFQNTERQFCSKEKSCYLTLRFCLTPSFFFIRIIMTLFFFFLKPACPERRVPCTIHLNFIPAATASKKKRKKIEGCLTTYHLVVPAHLTHPPSSRASITATPTSSTTSSACHASGMRLVSSENTGGRRESEAVRKRRGEASRQPPAAHA